MRESGEMYLETILVPSRKQNRVRAVDVATEMDISKASDSIALGKLKNEDCITVEPDGQLTFTEKGKAIAEKIYERHQVFSRVFMCLGVPEETAVADACKIEHDVSDVTFNAVKAYLQRHEQALESASAGE